MNLTELGLVRVLTVMRRCPKTRRLTVYRKKLHYFDKLSLPVLTDKSMQCTWGTVPDSERVNLLYARKPNGVLKPLPINTIC